jgi:heme iron utilization protein
MESSPGPADTIRRLVRSLPRVALGTVMRDTGGAPYVSLALAACDHDASPLLLLSDLADHSRNLRADPRASLLYDATSGLPDPLAGERATLVGRIEPAEDERRRGRYLRRHPSAGQYAAFADFHLWRMTVERAHLVAGFGRIHWVEGGDVIGGSRAALAEGEAGILDHMNREHRDALQLYAERLLGLEGGGWQMTGIDPEGIDLRRAAQTARLAFETPVTGIQQARAELERLAEAARASISPN